MTRTTPCRPWWKVTYEWRTAPRTGCRRYRAANNAIVRSQSPQPWHRPYPSKAYWKFRLSLEMARRHWVFGIAATIIGVVCIVFIVTSIGGSGIAGIFRSSNVNWSEYGWRVLDQTVSYEHIRILAKLEAKKIPRLKVEHVVGQDIFLLCEYVKGDHGSFAQKFDPSTASAV